MPRQPPRLPSRRRRSAQASTTERGYGYAHQRARAEHLAKHPLCQLCGKAWATDLHHVDRNPHNRAESNLQALCQSCHHDDVHG